MIKSYFIIEKDSVPKNKPVPGTEKYRAQQVATNIKTGASVWIVESETASGINDFKNNHSKIKERNNLKKFTDRENWEMHVFAGFDDGEKDFEEVIERGHKHFEIQEKTRRGELPTPLDVEKEKERKALKEAQKNSVK